MAWSSAISFCSVRRTFGCWARARAKTVSSIHMLIQPSTIRMAGMMAVPSLWVSAWAAYTRQMSMKLAR